MLDRPADRQPDQARRRQQRRERQRRHRQRLAAGEACAIVRYDGGDLDKLIRLQVLRECEVGDRKAIGRAFRQVLKNVRL